MPLINNFIKYYKSVFTYTFKLFPLSKNIGLNNFDASCKLFS